MLDRADSPNPGLPPPRRRRSRPGRARSKRAETEAEAAFLAGAALARLDAVVRRKPALGRRFPPAPRAQRRRRERARAPAGPRTRRLCATRSISPGRAPIPGRRDGGSSPGANCPPARPGNGVRLSTPPPRSWGSRTTRRLQEAIDAAEACAADKRPAPFAAAQVFGLARRALTANAGRRSLGRPGRGGRAARGLARRRRARAAAQMAVRAALARRAAVRGRGAARGGRPRRRRGDDAILFAYAKGGGARLRSLRRARAAGAKAAGGPPKLRAKGAPAALQALLDDDSLERRDENRRAFGARGATTVRPAGRPRGGARTDRTRDVPALRALSDGADPET